MCVLLVVGGVVVGVFIFVLVMVLYGFFVEEDGVVFVCVDGEGLVVVLYGVCVVLFSWGIFVNEEFGKGWIWYWSVEWMMVLFDVFVLVWVDDLLVFVVIVVGVDVFEGCEMLLLMGLVCVDIGVKNLW